MGTSLPRNQKFNILVVGQSGRIAFEALLFAASLRMYSPEFQGQLFVAEPQPGSLWDHDPRMSDPIKAKLTALGAQIVPFQSRHFGQSYPQGNKIEGSQILPAGEPSFFSILTH